MMDDDYQNFYQTKNTKNKKNCKILKVQNQSIFLYSIN